MRIAEPRYPVDYEDREIDCQEAMEAAFQAIIRDLEQTGRPAEEAAEDALQASISMDDDGILSEQLRSLVAWAVAAGWGEAEARSAIRQLAAHRFLSFEAPEDAESAVSAILRTLQ